MFLRRHETVAAKFFPNRWRANFGMAGPNSPQVWAVHFSRYKSLGWPGKKWFVCILVVFSHGASPATTCSALRCCESNCKDVSVVCSQVSGTASILPACCLHLFINFWKAGMKNVGILMKTMLPGKIAQHECKWHKEMMKQP